VKIEVEILGFRHFCDFWLVWFEGLSCVLVRGVRDCGKGISERVGGESCRIIWTEFQMASRVEIEEENDNTKGSMWVLDQKLDQPMDEEAGRLRNMYREKVRATFFSRFSLIYSIHL
jgi:hypothetical protein